MKEIVYISLRERVQVTDPIVFVKDVADVYTRDSNIIKEIREVPLFAFSAGLKCKKTEINEMLKMRERIKQYKANRQIISMLHVIQRVQQEGYTHLHLPSGQQNCIVEYIGDKKQHKWWDFFKVFFVCLICLAGGAFSIMAFHNDISISTMFQKFYEIVMGEKSSGNTVLEFFYSIGLGIGILIFYNHVGKRRITKDPTPIEVSMRTYEQDMNSAMVEDWEREGKMIDVDI